MKEKGSVMNRRQGLCCALLLLLMAACGYVGAHREAASTVSVDVTRSTYAPEVIETSSQDAALRLAADRDREIELLQEVMKDEAADQATRESAAAQLARVAKRIETEAQVAACMEHMGYGMTGVLCAEEMLTLFISAEKAADEEDAARIFDAAVSVTGLDASDIKIILTKK